MGWITPILVFAGVLFGGLINYLIARRNNSGSISTSDAANLWEEGNALRKEYRERAEKLEAQLEEVNAKLQTVTEDLSNLRANSATMITKIEELKKTIADLTAENRRLIALKKEDST